MMRHRTLHRALATALQCVRACAPPGSPVELLRKENMAGLSPTAAVRLLSHAYAAVVPIYPLPYPPLPLPVPGAPGPPGPCPTNFGPTGDAATPWLQLAVWTTLRRGPPALVLAGGQRLTSLPEELLQVAWLCAVSSPVHRV